MILYYSSQLCVFNGDGFQKEKLLLLKFFNNYSIKRFMKIIKIFKKRLRLSFDLNLYLKKRINFFLADILLLVDFKQNKKLKIFLIKKFLAFYFLKIYQIFLQEKKIRLEIFFALELENNFLNQNTSSKRHALSLEETPKYLKLKSLTTYKLSKKLNFSLKLKKKIYNKEYSLFSKFFRNINNVNNTSILVLGEGCDLYKGSITPFLSTKFNWFVSTGLKTDIECNFIDPFNTDPVEDLILDKEIIPGYSNIIFKVNNFKKKVIMNLKKTERNAFFYSITNNYGIKSFLSENRTTFNNKINYIFNFTQNFLLEKANLNKIYLKLYIFSKQILLNFIHSIKFNKICFLKNYSLSLNKKRENFFSILFKLSKSIKEYYSIIIGGVDDYPKNSFELYKSLNFFIVVQNKYISLIKKLLSILLLNLFWTSYKLNKFKQKKILKKKYICINFFNSIVHIYFLNFNFMKKVLSYINKNSYLDFYFKIFLIKKKRDLLKEKRRKEESEIRKLVYSVKLLKRYSWFNFHLFRWHYLYFLVDWKLNFDVLINDNLGIQYKYEFDTLDTSFSEMKEEWYILRLKSLKEFALYFFNFIEKIYFNLNKIFYMSFYINLNINYRFFISNLYLYLEKLLYKDLFSTKITFESTVNMSSLFLGKWFYYRQLHRFFDQSFDYNYSVIRKPPRFMNVSLVESNYNNLILKKNQVGFSSKLDCYFKKLNFEERNNIKLKEDVKFLKLKLKSLKEKNIFNEQNNDSQKVNNTFLKLKSKVKNYMEIKLYTFRKLLWFKRFTNSYNNFLKINYRIGTPLYKGGILSNGSKKRYYSKIWQKWQKFDIAYARKLEFLGLLTNNYYIEKEVVFSGTFLILFNKIKSRKINNSSYYSFWFNK